MHRAPILINIICRMCKINSMEADKSHKLTYAVSLSPETTSEWS